MKTLFQTRNDVCFCLYAFKADKRVYCSMKIEKKTRRSAYVVHSDKRKREQDQER